MHHHQRHPRSHPHPPVQPRWPENAHYAPNYPIYHLHPLKAAPVPVPVVRIPLTPAPHATVFVPRPPERFRRPSSPPPIHPQLHRRISIPRKHVHFNLPPRPPDHRHPSRKPSQAHLPVQDHNHRRPPTPAILPHQPAPPVPSASQPTIWILSYAHSLADTPSAANKILTAHLPTGTPHLYTIHAYDFTPPPAHICSAYSGVSPIVQDYVMRDPRARKAVADGIHDVLAHGRREMRHEKEGRRRAKKDVALSVCCMYGTHRSVSIAEKIAQGLMGMKLGVRVVVRHVHRVKGVKDLR